MLEKIKAMPLSVKLSILFLLGLTVVMLFVEPAITAGIVAVGLAIISSGRLIEYWISGR
jgi:hypothetical protein